MSWMQFAQLIDEGNPDPAAWAAAIEGNPNTPAQALEVALDTLIIGTDDPRRFDWRIRLCNILITLATIANNATSGEDGPEDEHADDHAYERDDRGPEYWRTNQTDLMVELMEHERNCNCPNCKGDVPAGIEEAAAERDPESGGYPGIDPVGPTPSSPSTVLSHWFGDLQADVAAMPDDQAVYLLGETVKPEIQELMDKLARKWTQDRDGVYRPHEIEDDGLE